MHLVGERDIELSSAPATGPNLWFNDKQVTAGDITCLDVNPFGEFFDLVLEQHEQERPQLPRPRTLSLRLGTR